jgi:hypothetical protein
VSLPQVHSDTGPSEAEISGCLLNEKINKEENLKGK